MLQRRFHRFVLTAHPVFQNYPGAHVAEISWHSSGLVEQVAASEKMLQDLKQDKADSEERPVMGM